MIEHPMSDAEIEHEGTLILEELSADRAAYLIGACHALGLSPERTAFYLDQMEETEGA